MFSFSYRARDASTTTPWLVHSLALVYFTNYCPVQSARIFLHNKFLSSPFPLVIMQMDVLILSTVSLIKTKIACSLKITLSKYARIKSDGKDCRFKPTTQLLAPLLNPVLLSPLKNRMTVRLTRGDNSSS